MMMSSTCMPQFSVRSSMRRNATRVFHSAVRACPSSSMQRPMTAAPCSFATVMILMKRDSGPSPSS